MLLEIQSDYMSAYLIEGANEVVDPFKVRILKTETFHIGLSSRNSSVVDEDEIKEEE